MCKCLTHISSLARGRLEPLTPEVTNLYEHESDCISSGSYEGHAVRYSFLKPPVFSVSLWLYWIINDSDLCEDTDHINEFSIIINNDFTRLEKIEFSLGIVLVTFAVTHPSIEDTNAIVPSGHHRISLDCVMRVVVRVAESKLD